MKKIVSLALLAGTLLAFTGCSQCCDQPQDRCCPRPCEPRPCCDNNQGVWNNSWQQ